jgi:uncharacterized protein (TIGR02145 family)
LATAQLKDASGNTYKTMRIGGKEWMVENLRTTKYADGGTIDKKQSDEDWGNLGEKPAMCTVTGPDGKEYVLYAGFVFTDGRSVAPEGWRIPTAEDSEALVAACFANGELTAEGKAFLGSTAQIGFRQNNGVFKKMGESVSWWVEIGAPSFMPSHTMEMSTKNNTMYTMDISARDEGHSIRLVRD